MDSKCGWRRLAAQCILAIHQTEKFGLHRHFASGLTGRHVPILRLSNVLSLAGLEILFSPLALMARWTAVSQPIFNNNAKFVVFANSLFVAVGGSNVQMAMSSDGVFWSSVADIGVSPLKNGVGFGNSTWIALGGVGLPNLEVSTDLQVWTSDAASPFTTLGSGAAFSENLRLWIVSGGNGPTTNTLAFGSPGNWGLPSPPNPFQFAGYFAAVRRLLTVLSTQSVTANLTVVGPAFIARSSSVSVAGGVSLTVLGDMNVEGVLVMATSSSVSVSGSFISAGQLQLSFGATLHLLHYLSIGASSSLVISTVPATVTTVVVASFSNLTGVFQSVTINNCQAQAIYGISSLSVLVPPPCSSSSGLSGGAMAGIVVGSVVGAVLLCLTAILLSRILLRRSDARKNTDLALKLSEAVAR